MVAKKKQNEPEETPPNPPIVQRTPGFSSKFKEDLAWWFKTDYKKASKILDMVTAVMADPFQGIGKPEPLKYLSANIWSRRIDLEHRLVYRLSNTQIDFLACRFYYEGN